MAISKINIQDVSKLANLPISGGEKQLYEVQLSLILDYVAQIESVNTINIDPTFNVTPSIKIMRKNVVNKSITQKDAISNASTEKDGYFVSKGVFENE